MSDLEETYFKLTYVQEESYWHEFIYHTETLEFPADQYDCSFICRNVERDRPCDLFVFEVPAYSQSHDRIEVVIGHFLKIIFNLTGRRMSSRNIYS